MIVLNTNTVANKGCLLELEPQGDSEKVNFYLQCPSCQAMQPFDVSNCDIYGDLGIETSEHSLGCIVTAFIDSLLQIVLEKTVLGTTASMTQIT